MGRVPPVQDTVIERSSGFTQMEVDDGLMLPFGQEHVLEVAGTTSNGIFAVDGAELNDSFLLFRLFPDF